MYIKHTTLFVHIEKRVYDLKFNFWAKSGHVSSAGVEQIVSTIFFEHFHTDLFSFIPSHCPQ